MTIGTSQSTDQTTDQTDDARSDDPNAQSVDDGLPERRRRDRADDLDWESKVIGRLHGRLQHLPMRDATDQPVDSSNVSWEAGVLDVLRRRIERGPV